MAEDGQEPATGGKKTWKQRKAEEMRLWRLEMRQQAKQKKLTERQEKGNQAKQGKRKQPEDASSPPEASSKKKAKASKKQAAEEEQEDDGGGGVAAEGATKAKKKAKLQDASTTASAGDTNEEAPPKKKKKQSADSVASEKTSANATGVESGGDAELYKVCVAGIPLNVDEGLLKRDFQECGEILAIRLLRDRTTKKSRGIAFISFATKEALDAALGFHGTDYGGRELVVQVAESKGKPAATNKTTPRQQGSDEKPLGCTSVMVKNLPYGVTEQELRKLFGGCGQGPANINILVDKTTGKSKGMAFVDFDDGDAVDEAKKLSGNDFGGRFFEVDYAKPREKSQGPGEKPEGCLSVVVKGLDYSVTEADLKKAFGKCGEGVEACRLSMDKKTGEFKGIAFLDFATDAAVEEAVKLHGKTLKGRRFIVDYSQKSGDPANGDKNGMGRKPEGCTSITVKGLADKVTEEMLLKKFRKCGSGPRSVNLVMDKTTGMSSGLAFVNFSDEAAVKAAEAFHNTDYKGQTITLGYVKPKPKPVKRSG
eukprot:TRINITY_DN115463_c0_g1_i1.p1 TRINITY_DN115463_c0_g1~~TRINITY_DN115463_c0_g1_i1.p1  ORF type:complete len:538 (-),score=191.55 TRINITY_DN115463_c0_g1_i1:357-1970(-)